MADYTQDLIWTVLPFGQSEDAQHHVYLNFSVIVSPRLKSTSSAQTVLSNYPDWSTRSWTDTIAALASSFALETVIGSTTNQYPASLIGAHQPDSARFAAMLPGSTPVTPYVYAGFENRKIRSAPVGTVTDILANLYGEFGTKSPAAYPAYNDLVPATAFGPLGFEQSGTARGTADGDRGIPGDGAVRKQRLVAALENALAQHKAIPYDLSGIAGSLSPSIPGAAASLAFLQHQRFLQRGLQPGVTPVTLPTAPAFDFHQIVASVMSLPTLLRVLGLVLDLRAGPIETHSGVYGTGTAQFVLDNTRLAPGTTSKLPAVQCTIVKDGIFRPLPKNASATDHELRMLKVGDPSLYRIVRVDHDSSAVKAMQFANTVTRSHRGGTPLTQSTPGRFALPALRTGGFAIARSGRAVQMAATLQRQTATLQDGYFVNGTDPTLYEEDITRGYRFDILDRTDGVWRSLMWRQGTVTVDGTAALPVLEEDCVVPSPTTATAAPGDSGDLYLQETLARWDGWSLAVPRVGKPFQDQDLSSDDSGSSGFHVTTDWHVPGSAAGGAAETTTGNHHRLPRLRFGDSYQVRARAVDLAGNSLLVDLAPKSGADIISAPLRHLRFEPIAAPRALFVTPPGPAGAEEVVVIRSESATVNGTAAIDNGRSVRLLVPPPGSVFLAEQHGAFDLTSTGSPMNQALALYQDLAQRDGRDVGADGELADPSAPHSTSNPYFYPPFLPINYLPDWAARAALLRGLPANSSKHTVARLGFNAAQNTWPKLQAARIVLGRGSKPDWKVQVVTDPNDSDNVTSELELALGKGDMVTVLVNGQIGAPVVDVMAIWEWIEHWATAHNIDPAAVYKAILAGEHWMITPWRPMTFVHAVRTPLKDPRLFLHPAKSAIGQTYAAFDSSKRIAFGTVLMSRKSTARIDVDGTWAMPIDTGDNADPVTPQQFAGHAFTIELSRDGKGVDPTATTAAVVKVPDAENFQQRHEFNDTKFRAVTYKATATSYYVEYFREQKTLTQTVSDLTSAPVEPGVAFEASTVKLTLEWDGGSRTLVAAPPGTAPTAPAPTPGDFAVVQDPSLGSDPAHATHGTIQILANANLSGVPSDATPVFSYVGPTIHTYSSPSADHTTSNNMLVPNSKRPIAPSVRYVIPIYGRSVGRGGAVTHKGGALRVYLDRPWWSSGDGERLGVLCWHPPKHAGVLPAGSIAPYVSLWGFDPVFESTTSMPGQPTPACFPLATARDSNGNLSIDESSDHVDVAGHDVGFDTSRKLWYCDIRVTGPDGKELSSYTPFIRFAFARYQPVSIEDTHLSKVVVVDYAQLAPNRSLTMTGSGSTKRKVTVVGRAPVGTAQSPHSPSRMIAIVEQRDPRIADDALAWSPATGQSGYQNTYTLQTSVAHVDEVTWQGEIHLPVSRAKRQLRVTFEEYERIAGGAGHGRLVFTESIPIT